VLSLLSGTHTEAQGVFDSMCRLASCELDLEHATLRIPEIDRMPVSVFSLQARPGKRAVRPGRLAGKQARQARQAKPSQTTRQACNNTKTTCAVGLTITERQRDFSELFKA